MSKKQIYDALVSAGMTREGACGFMGNLQAESGCEACRLQGDFSEGRTTSRAYVAAVANGIISRAAFGSDQKGFGLAQWTYHTRKLALYDFWRGSGEALDSDALQIAFALQELRTMPEYSGVWAVLTASHDLYQCAKIVCEKYECPAVNNIDARAQLAVQIYDELASSSEISNSSHLDPDKPDADPIVRMLQACMAQNGAWPEDRIDGVKTPEFRTAIVDYAAAVASC